MQRKGIAYAIISSATFGLLPLFSVTAMGSGQTPYSVLFYRFLLSTLLYGLFLKLRGESFRVSLRQLLELVVLGAGCYGGTALFLILSYAYIPTGIATTINFLYPVMVALILFVLFGERPSLGIAVAIVLSLGGVALMAWSPGANLSLRGVAYSFITIFCYGFYVVGLNKTGLREVRGSTVTLYVLLVSTIFFGIIALANGGIVPITSPRVGVNLLLLAIVSTIISNLTLVLAVKEIGSTSASVLGSMEPLTALLVGIGWFGEAISGYQLAGIGLVIASVLLVVLGRRKDDGKRQPKSGATRPNAKVKEADVP
ncbi:DMT family transporter [uncultured Acetobacteroides sp.]|uniref:DMT family transporter n=1 Tax=uncultured Acetobacteroides sp. TaxID=1760811 RepID=UPI0029F5481D|nr:DMT family transporter [uncultured Acetobacteroides sp.]